VHADLEALLKLQEKDKTVMDIEEELGSVDPVLEDLDGELAKVEANAATARKRMEEADTRRGELESKIESYRVMQERRRQRLEWVRGAKEASALMAELDLARSVMAKEEAEWLRSADRVQEAERVTTEAEQALEELKLAQAPKREEMAAKRAECEDRLAAAMREREAATKNVKSTFLDLYERIRQGRAPLVLYALQGGACGYCYTAVPLNRRQKILNGQTVEACEACGVLIYDPGE
jgi:predicted  nucleic acid-binding Zn-ribbon protein